METTFSFNTALTAFLQEYILFPRNAYNKDGTLTRRAVREAIEMLLDGEVFYSFDDMRREALRNYRIVIPERVGRHCNGNETHG